MLALQIPSPRGDEEEPEPGDTTAHFLLRGSLRIIRNDPVERPREGMPRTLVTTVGMAKARESVGLLAWAGYGPARPFSCIAGMDTDTLYWRRESFVGIAPDPYVLGHPSTFVP